jgi:hypothetical protein
MDVLQTRVMIGEYYGCSVSLFSESPLQLCNETNLCRYQLIHADNLPRLGCSEHSVLGGTCLASPRNPGHITKEAARTDRRLDFG